MLDTLNFKVRRAGHQLAGTLWFLLRSLLTVLSLVVVGYVIFALVYSTPEEKRLKAENKLYAELYPGLTAKAEGLSGDIERLSRKDDIIYKDIFHSEPPTEDPVSQLFFGSDTIPDRSLVFYTAAKADRLVGEAETVDSLFVKIASSIRNAGSLPPMRLPLDSLNHTQVGAGIGTRTNPFYTTRASHKGVDFIVARGTPVYAAADGIVSSAVRSRKGDGNTVSIKHKGGYVTRYCHLDEINVSQGQSVRKGQKIATVGMSGNSYAPHLHYEVRRDSLILDPMGYIFASVPPREYASMLYTATHTRQSMD